MLERIKWKYCKNTNVRTFSQLWNMVVALLWFGPVLLHLNHRSLPSLLERYILSVTVKSVPLQAGVQDLPHLDV